MNLQFISDENPSQKASRLEREKAELQRQLADANAEIARLQLALTQIVTIANSSKEVTSYIKHMVDMFTIAEAALKSPTEP